MPEIKEHHTVMLRRLQAALFALGMFALLVAVLLTSTAGYQYGGGSEHFKEAMTFACMMIVVTFGAALLFSVWEVVRSMGYTQGARLVLMFALAFGVGEFFGHLMTVGGQRAQQVTQADKSDFNLATVKADIATTESSITTMEALVKNRAEQAQWLSTKPSAAWKAEVREKETAIDVEKRRGGCGPICLKLTGELKPLLANLAVAETHEREVADLQRMKDKLTQLRNQATETKVGESSARVQGRNLARLVSFGGTEVKSEDANFFLDVFYALLWTVGPAGILWASVKDWTRPVTKTQGGMLAGLRKMRDHIDGKAPAPAAHVPTTEAIAARFAPAQPANASVPSVQPEATQAQVNTVVNSGEVAPVDIPVNVRVEVQQDDRHILMPPRRISNMRDSAMAKRIAAATRPFAAA